MKRLAAIILVGLLVFSARPAHAASYLPVIEKAPPFNLVAAGGHEISTPMLAGKVVVLAFMYTHCTTQCPLVVERLGKLEAALVKQPELGTAARILSISFDPQRDTAPYLAEYARAVGANPESWSFLTGRPREIRKLLSDYGFYARREANGDFDHVSRIYLIDANGSIRQIYSTTFLDPAVVLRDIKSLIAERDETRLTRLAR